MDPEMQHCIGSIFLKSTLSIQQYFMTKKGRSVIVCESLVQS